MKVLVGKILLMAEVSLGKPVGIELRTAVTQKQPLSVGSGDSLQLQIAEQYLLGSFPGPGYDHPSGIADK